MLSLTRSQLHRYSIAVLAVVVALLLTLLLRWQLKTTLYPLFLAAVMISSWYGGIGPGLLATVLAALGSAYFFIPPVYLLALSQTEIAGLSQFVLVALLIVMLNAALRSAKQRAEFALTKLKASEEALRASQMLFESFMNHTPTTAFIKDSAGRYVYVNHILEHLFNRKLADWIGKTDFDMFPSKAAQQWRDNDLVVLTTGKTIQTLEMVPYDDGQHYYMSFKFPIADVSGRQLLGGVSIDITELKRLEAERNQLLVREQAARVEAEAANRSKDEFLAIVSHELRTPLTAILGWAGMLQAGQLDQARSTLALETIERNANLQMQLIEDLLDITRIIREEIWLNLGLVDLVSAIAAAIDVVQPMANAKAIQLEFVLDAKVAPIWGDSDRLQQVVWNLLSNAIKFTPEGGRVEVRLSAISGSEQQATHNYAQIQVSDTGQGIGADFLPYIFDRFRQADSKSNRSNKGLGLGLAIARHLVELHGGTIQAESPGIGQGATFTVKLPQTAVPSPQDSLASHPDQMQPPNVEEDAVPLDSHPTLEDLQVLVVDDEADTREWLSLVLQECGAHVIAVDSVDEALKAIKQLKPNVLLSDIGMPGEDGYALIRKVRELEPDMGGRIPAVALTVYARVEDYKEALSAGFQLHVTKPIRAAELVAVVASLAKMSGKL